MQKLECFYGYAITIARLGTGHIGNSA